MTNGKNSRHEQTTMPTENNLKKRILLVLAQASHGVGGAETLALYLLRELANDFEFHIVYTENGTLAKEFKKLGAFLATIPVNGKFDFMAASRIAKYVRTNRVDTIHSQQISNDFYSAWASLMTGIPLIITRHANITSFAEISSAKRHIYSFFDRFSTFIAKKMIFVSDHCRLEFLSNTNTASEKFITIHNGIDTNHFMPTSRQDGIIRNIGMIAQMTDAKDYETFLSACGQISIGHPDLKFHLIGDGPNRKSLEAMAFNLGIYEKCVFTGYRRDIPELLQKLDIFVLSSKREGLPMVILEAMAAGIPVIASNVGGNKEIVTSKTGMLIPPQDKEALTLSMETLLSDKALYKMLKTNGRHFIENNFHIQMTAEKYSVLYKDMLLK